MDATRNTPNVTRNQIGESAPKLHKSGPACGVCIHPRRDEFDRALLKGTMTCADVAREVGCHRSSVTRHKKLHLLPAAQEQAAQSVVTAGGEVDVLTEIRTLYQRMKANLVEAENVKNWQAIKAYYGEARQLLELLAKLLGELDERPVVNVLISSEWIGIRTAILQALLPYPDARSSVARALADVEQSSGRRPSA